MIAGSKFEVEWDGPRNEGDYLAIFIEGNKNYLSFAYSYREEDASPVEMTAPEKPGIYEVRYTAPGRATFARQKLIVR